MSKNLYHFNLDLSNNSLCENFHNFTHISLGIKSLISLNSLNLNLAENDIGLKNSSFPNLIDSLKYLENLTSLSLNLKINHLEKSNPDFFKSFNIVFLKQKLKFFSLSLRYNSIGDNPDFLKGLSIFLHPLDKITNLNLNLAGTNLIENKENFVHLKQILKNLPFLKHLKLKMAYNYLGEQPELILLLVDCFK